MTEMYGYKWSTPMGDAMIGDDLSLAAQTWRRGLSGFTKKDIGRGFAQIMAKNLEWPPSLLEFRKLCMTPVDAPSLQDVISTLVNLPGYGTLVERYKHPMVLAVAMKVDMFAVLTARGDRLNAMIKPVYERLLVDGWDDWPDHAGESQKSLGVEKKPVNRDIAMASLAKMRELL